MEQIQKRKFAEFITEENLEGAGGRFALLSKEIFDKGMNNDDVPLKSIIPNKYRPVTKEGLDKIDASMKFHHSNKLKSGQVKSSATRIFLCQSSNRGEYIVLDGNHRVAYWKSQGNYFLN